jgi:hypothetical protein
MTTTPSDDEGLREELAAIEHERWADWQKWCHKVLRENNPSPEIGDVLERWDRQIETPYSELSEKEKDSDREQVDRYWPLISQKIREARIDEARRIKEHFDGIPPQTKVGNSPHDFVISQLNEHIAALTTKQDTKEK